MPQAIGAHTLWHVEPNSILVVTREGVALANLAEGSARLLVPGGRWPAWNPLYDMMAVSVVSDGPSQLRLVDFEGRTERVFYEAAAGVPPAIAPLVPHYMMWSPGGNALCYVAQSSFGMALFLSDIDGKFGPDAVINAAPLFSAWCTDNNFLAVHAGEELAVVEIDGSRSTAEVHPKALGFRTPAYSDDAEVLAYAVASPDGGVVIMRAHFQGTGSEEVCAFGSGVALAFRPGTQLLTVAVSNDAESGGFDELWAVDLAEPAYPKRQIYKGQFVSFLWAPTGEHVIVIVPSYSGDGRYAARCLEANGAPKGSTESFAPSEDMRIYLAFFDQYANSHALWSPDGHQFLICGTIGSDRVPASFGDSNGDYVYLWDVTENKPLRTVAPGSIGFFPPLPKTLR